MEIAVFFDVDDTLLDNYEAFKATLLHFFSEQKLNERQLKELYKKFRHCSDVVYQDYQKKQSTSKVDNFIRWKLITEELSENHDSKLLTKLDDLYHTNQRKQVLAKEYVNLFSFLSHCQVHVGVLTNGLAKSQARKIKQLGLSNYVAGESFFISENMNDAKPNLSCFKKVEQQLPNAVDLLIYLGDSFKNDIAPLLKTHWVPIWLNRFNEKVEQKGFIEVKSEEEAVIVLRKLVGNKFIE